MREQYSTQLAMAAGGLVLVANAVFAIVQSPELLGFRDSSVVKSAPALRHEVDGAEDCRSCHAVEGLKPYPLLHAGWSGESCLRCHFSGAQPSSPQGAEDRVRAGSRERASPPPADPDRRQGVKATGARVVPPLPHLQEGMENCLDCHENEGERPFPEDHAGRSENKCTACHRPAPAR